MDSVYLYRKNALYGLSYEIVRKTGGEMVPVGNYAVLDSGEDQKITEIKLMNLVALMNGQKNLLDTAKVTGRKTLFQILPNAEGDSGQRILFREYDGTGISSENAILSLEERPS